MSVHRSGRAAAAFAYRSSSIVLTWLALWLPAGLASAVTPVHPSAHAGAAGVHAAVAKRRAAARTRVPMAAAAATVTATAAVAVVTTRTAPAAGRKPDPEVLLVEVYKALAAQQLRQAEQKAEALVAAYPNFRLGQLIRGDLLMMHTHQVKGLGDASGAAPEALRNLREEAMVRLKSLRERPDPNLLPRAIVKLRDDQKFALLVDAKRSRLYVYQHIAGGLKFMSDYYVSQGKLGVNKLREGDQKTPLGVYYITSRLGGARLPDFYGAGALPINYPNDWDRVNGRSGSGIWLHGTPPDSYSRPPLSSDGCVVLTNQDLSKLLASIEIGKTPVVISENVEFVSKEKWESERTQAMRLIEAWRADAESADPVRVGANYAPDFKSDRGEDLVTWLDRHIDFVTGGAGLSYQLRDVTTFLYPGSREMLVITFTQQPVARGGRLTGHPVRKRQYWALLGKNWKIVAESLI